MSSIPTTEAAAARALTDLPGPRGLPWLGNALQVQPQRFHRQLEDWAGAHGDPYTFSIGKRQFMVTAAVDSIGTVLRRRPDVAQAEYQLAATDAALAAARKRFLPQVRLSAAAGAAISTLLSDPIAIWSIGGSVLAPLFQGGRLEAQAESAAAQRDAAAFTYRRVALTAFREVEDNLAAVRYLSLQLDRLRAQRTALADGLRLATNRYRAGYSSYLEQLDAQRGLLASELALIQTQADALTARVALYQAMGGGWTAEDAVADPRSKP